MVLSETVMVPRAEYRLVDYHAQSHNRQIDSNLFFSKIRTDMRTVNFALNMNAMRFDICEQHFEMTFQKAIATDVLT